MTIEAQVQHDYVEDWVESPVEMMDTVGIDEDTEIAATGMPRAWFMSHEDNEASSADVILGNVIHKYGDEADIKAYRESETFNIERALGEPGWKFPTARNGRNENMVIAEGSDASAIETVVRDTDVHLFADAASYTGHELGHENRQTDESYGRVEEVLEQDLGEDTGLVTIKNFPYFHDTASQKREEANFSEYVTHVADQVDDLYDEATVIGQSTDPEQLNSRTDPGVVYILGEQRL
jgi:hypothetical protein